MAIGPWGPYRDWKGDPIEVLGNDQTLKRIHDVYPYCVVNSAVRIKMGPQTCELECSISAITCQILNKSANVESKLWTAGPHFQGQKY
jgi:coenzyme F420-reducing hydrogenase gamma subunit